MHIFSSETPRMEVTLQHACPTRAYEHSAKTAPLDRACRRERIVSGNHGRTIHLMMYVRKRHGGTCYSANRSRTLNCYARHHPKLSAVSETRLRRSMMSLIQCQNNYRPGGIRRGGEFSCDILHLSSLPIHYDEKYNDVRNTHPIRVFALPDSCVD